MWISDRSELLDLCKHLDSASEVAIDTEFAAERRYYPRFDLLQVGTTDIAAAVDVRANLDLTPLFDRLCDPARTVVLHSGSMDLAIIYRREGRLPARVFDTQLAAAMVGYGPQIGYSALVKKITGVYLSKAETLTDWSRRPLKPEQVEYALDDVRYLPPVYEHLVQKLKEMQRLEWYEEEARLLIDPQRIAAPSPRACWRRLRAWQTLSPRQLGVLQELAAWREEEAISRDVPSRAVVPDDVLVHLSRRQPSKVKELREVRRIFERTVKDCGEAILEAIKRGLESPDETAIAQVLSDALPPPPPGLVSLLHSVIESKAEAQEIASNLLFSGGDLELLISDLQDGRAPSVGLVSGWRRDVAGRDVLHLLTGAASVRFDPATRNVIVDLRHEQRGEKP